MIFLGKCIFLLLGATVVIRMMVSLYQKRLWKKTTASVQTCVPALYANYVLIRYLCVTTGMYYECWISFFGSAMGLQEIPILYDPDNPVKVVSRFFSSLFLPIFVTFILFILGAIGIF